MRGCELEISYDEILKHKDVCDYNEIECKEKCGWKGILKNLPNHVRKLWIYSIESRMCLSDYLEMR